MNQPDSETFQPDSETFQIDSRMYWIYNNVSYPNKIYLIATSLFLSVRLSEIEVLSSTPNVRLSEVEVHSSIPSVRLSEIEVYTINAKQGFDYAQPDSEMFQSDSKTFQIDSRMY